ncbi:MAG: methylthioribulose 1-phosphate dehydratase [Candidatus Eremiobacteraeota bacterium]|nr:methylthioribulose 1-phosphate dehydratase [Candidatus Eremiobacteraeota bacterium]
MFKTTASEAFEEIAAVGRFAASRGWVPATSGNFSRRLDERSIAITRSGADKGDLAERDIAMISLDEPLPPGVSAEAPLHVARYKSDASVGAILHVHSVAATVLSRLCEREGAVSFDGYEMHKTIEGFATHEHPLRVPVFSNAQDTASLAERIEARVLQADPFPGYLLAGHGIYAWGATMRDARRHLEGLEFLLECQLEEWRVTR